MFATPKPTAVIADDTDVLLVYHADASDESENLHMITTKQTICVTILKKKLNPLLTDSLLFLHAFSCCDTTSRPYGVGKATVCTKYEELQHSTSAFVSPSASKDQIAKARIDAMLVIYDTSATESLTDARVVEFQQMVATSTGFVPPEKLPPTNDAAILHSYRAYHQVHVWQGHDLNPEDWGWTKSSDGLHPIRMTQSAAPEKLFTIIRCNCSGKCNKKVCTCCKNGLLCTPARGQCKGITCLNVPPSERCDDDDIDHSDERNE